MNTTVADEYFIVVSSNSGGNRVEEPNSIQQGNNGQIQGGDQISSHSEPRIPLDYLFDSCKDLYVTLQATADSYRDIFQQRLANVRYFHSLLLNEVERLDQVGVEAQADRKDPQQMLDELRHFDQQVLDWDYRNSCWAIVRASNNLWVYATSLYFIILPLDLDFWGDSDPSTLRFRLYFLCDHWKQDGAREDLAQHVHLANHPGYIINRPKQFFDTFGDYVLRVMRMIKRGYLSDVCDIPPLNTFKIMWNCDPNVTGIHLTNETIGLHFDKTIAHLEEMSLPKWKKPGLSRDQSYAIIQYLDKQDGDNGDGSLHRYVHDRRYMSWRCGAHAHQFLDHKTQERLQEFVIGRGGHVDMQQAEIKVELRSTIEADQFETLLAGLNFPFYSVTVKLSWELTRSYAVKMFTGIARTGAIVLEIDGITLDIHPQGAEHYRSNLIVDCIIDFTGLQFITLLNYPRLQEQSVYIGQASLQSAISPRRFSNSWVDLKSDLMEIYKPLSKQRVASDCSAVVAELQAVLERHGQRDVTLVTLFRDTWNATFDLEKGSCVEAYSQDAACPKSILSSRSLRTLVASLDDLRHGQDFLRMVQSNTGIQDLRVSHLGNNVVRYIDHIVRRWCESSCPRLTLEDRLLDSEGRSFAQLAINRSNGDLPGRGAFSGQGNSVMLLYSEQEASDVPVDIEFVQWDCDHVFSPLSDYSAAFLDMATKQHPPRLALLTLDVSQLSFVGFASVKNLLSRSSLEHLNILSSAVDLSLSKSIAQVLGSVQWPTLNSLVLSGDYIDEWLQLWPSPTDAPLLCLQIQGTGPGIQELSHSSVLILHKLFLHSSLIELHLRGVQLRDERDWVLLVESMDFLLLVALDIGEATMQQLISTTNAADLFVSRLKTATRGAARTILFLTAFTLDITAQTDQSVMTIQRVLSLCSVQELCIMCHPFSSRLSDPIAQVLDSVHWDTIESLELRGDALNDWIVFLAKIEAPRLKRLIFSGTPLVEQGLSHTGVLFVQKLIDTCFLVRLHIVDVMLEDKSDWVVLVQSMSPSLLRNFVLRGRSSDQFTSTPEAVALADSKWLEMTENGEGGTEE